MSSGIEILGCRRLEAKHSITDVGAVAVRGGIVLSLAHMNRVLEIDEENLTATLESGVLRMDFARAQGLQSWLFCLRRPFWLATAMTLHKKTDSTIHIESVMAR